MNNGRFYFLLGQPKDEKGKRLWTLEKVSAAIYSGRAHVNEVINNKPGKGGQTRKRLVKFFKANFTYWRDIVACLGWDDQGRIVPCGTLHCGTNKSAPAALVKV